MIHYTKGFIVVNEAEVDVFIEFIITKVSKNDTCIVKFWVNKEFFSVNFMQMLSLIVQRDVVSSETRC